MMNKAKKKVIEAKAIENIYTLTLERADSENEYCESLQQDLQELLSAEEPNEYRIDIRKQDIEEIKMKVEAYKKLAEQLFKLM